MKNRFVLFFALLILIFALGACTAPGEPEDVVTDTKTEIVEDVKTEDEEIIQEEPESDEPEEEILEVIEDNDPENSLFAELDSEGASSDFVALIINQPSDDVLGKATELETYFYDQSGETMLIVPRYENSRVELKTLRQTPNGDMEEAGTIYVKDNTPDGYALFLYAERPEGMPSLSVKVMHEGMTSKYNLSYDGQDGTPELEYVETSFNFDEIDDSVKFNYREAAHVFNLDFKAITEKFGEPDAQNPVTYMYLAAIELIYGENIFRVEQTSGYVYETELVDNTIMAPRDLGVSSTSAAVLSAFPNESDGTRLPMNDDSGYEYEVLYTGDDESAAAIYDGDDLVRAEYRSGAVVLVFEFEDDIVHKIIYKTEF